MHGSFFFVNERDQDWRQITFQLKQPLGKSRSRFHHSALVAGFDFQVVAKG